MNNQHLKQRRPYGQEAPSGSVLQPPPAPVLPVSYIDPLTPHDLEILSEAGHIIKRLLDVSCEPVPQLGLAAAQLGLPARGLSNIRRQQQPELLYFQPQPQRYHYQQQEQHRPNPYKRQRLNTDMPISSLFSSGSSGQGAQEKSPDTGRPSINDNSRTSFLGVTAAQIKECFGSVAMCPPNSGYETQTTYQPVPSTPAYGYSPCTSYSAELLSPDEQAVPEYQAVPNTGLDQSGMFAVDQDPMFVAQLQRYPPLKPTRNLSDQPTTSREGMVYPPISTNSVFFRPEGTGREFQPAGLENVAPFVQSGQASYASNGILAATSSPYTRSGMISGASSSKYSLPQAYFAADTIKPDQLDPIPLLSHTASNLEVVMVNQKPPTVKRGPFKDQLRRQQTAHVRKIGSCIRCKMQRIRCEIDPNAQDDENAPCLSCCKILSGNSKIHRLPCRRWKITEVKLFKPGQVKGFEWTRRWNDNTAEADIGQWANAEVKTIRVTEGYTGDFVELRVRRFVPQPGDKLERTWVENGQKKSVEIPPFALVDLDAVKSSYEGYVKKGLTGCCKRLLGPKEKLLWRTYELAMRRSQDPGTSQDERELIRSTLELWMAIRLTTKSCEIVGDETLGMPHNLVRGSGIPLPPVMGAQIDSILLNHTLPRLRRETLEMLQAITTKKMKKTWLTTYLVTFILLHNVALITKHDASYARKHGMQRRFAREDMVKQYHLGANIFLSYYHYCNRGVYPFSDECKDSDLQTLAELDVDSIAFVKYTRKYIAEHKREWEDLRAENEFENDYFFVSQLYDQNWTPKPTI